eukprot:CAMPEP_0175135006 /NCGR_PEP_ID=MMETSP0087-20121206/8481_1 /TAXON_ID=136419 /ORGANISM="Unknown Unknown, Strain D1" /LENGTH=90 /DNA_ID=CAMNT_0016417605 /DNA_START=194 /DNA_END=466 /DNA_ORIENTATION=-
MSFFAWSLVSTPGSRAGSRGTPKDKTIEDLIKAQRESRGVTEAMNYDAKANEGVEKKEIPRATLPLLGMWCAERSMDDDFPLYGFQAKYM